MYLFTELGPLVQFARARAQRGFYDGIGNDRNMRLIASCSHLFAITPESSARMIFTRDIGHHSSGWWKNPDYERCFHLSISFCVNPTDEPLPFDRKQAERIARAFFGDDAAKAWVERPYSAQGKHCDVYHYRLFCDAAWHPIVPRREVYSKDDTPPDWKSFSELHGFTPAPEQAPFLKAASE
jgi:hypothetical protein